jgi:hypothetical protein
MRMRLHRSAQLDVGDVRPATGRFARGFADGPIALGL